MNHVTVTIETFDKRYTYTNISHITTMIVTIDTKTTWSECKIEL